MSSAIQKADVVTLDATEHAKRMEAMRGVIRAALCPKGISEEEFALFMEQAKRSGLDPLLKQAFCVPRRFNAGNRERPNWQTKHEFQPSEAGMLARAEQFPDYEGISAAEVYGEDPISLDYGKGEVQHSVNPAKRKGGLVGAWARVQRKGKVPTLVWVDFDAAKQDSPLWAKMPAVMVRKAARVAALRTAYPEAFGGMYVAGERPDDVEAEDEPTAPTMSKPAMPATTATREATSTLERAPEKVPVVMFGGAVAPKADVVDAETVPNPPAREPGSDDGDEDPIASECEAIVYAAQSVTLDGYAALAKRAAALPNGSDERKRAAKALREAHTRISGSK